MNIRQELSNLIDFQVDLNTFSVKGEGFTLTCMDEEEAVFRVEFDGVTSEDRLLYSDGGEWEIWLDDYRVPVLCFSLSGALKTLSGLYRWRQQ